MIRKGLNPIGTLIMFGIVLTLIWFLAAGFLGAMVGGAHNLKTVNNETHTINTSSLPETFTVNRVKAGVLEDSENLYDPSTGEELELSDYSVVSYRKGRFNVTEYKTGSGNQDIAIDYVNKKETGISGKVMAGRNVFNAYNELTPYLAVLIIAGVMAWLVQSV